jgi:hypothetical protein
MSNPTSDPTQWLGLLKWSLKYHDNTRPSTDFNPLSQQDKEWLEKFFQSIIVDEVARMKEIVDQLEAKAKQRSENSANANVGDDDDSVTNLFEELVDITSNIDRARDLNKIEKFAVIVQMLRSPLPQFRRGACDVIATCAQNNPDMQNAALSLSALEYLAHMVIFDPIASVRSKALMALSAIIRNNDYAEQKFVDEGDGELILARGVKDGSDPKLQKRCMFLMLHLVRSRANFAAKAVELGVAQFLLEACSNGDFNDDLDLAEGIIQLLISIASKTPECKQALLRADAVRLLNQRLTAFKALTGEDVDRAHVESKLISDLLAILGDNKSGSAASTSGNNSLAAAAIAPAAPRNTVYSYTTETPQPQPSSANTSTGPFVPTNEWQHIRDGQAVPPGLHIRMNMETGEKMARIPDPNDTREGTIIVKE